MPLFALCPSCKELKIQVYEEAVGQTIICPQCAKSFPINASDLIYDPVAVRERKQAESEAVPNEPVALGLPEWVGTAPPTASRRKKKSKKRSKKGRAKASPEEMQQEPFSEEGSLGETMGELTDTNELTRKAETETNHETPAHIAEMLNRPQKSEWELETYFYLGSVGSAVLAFGVTFVPYGRIGTVLFGVIGLLLAWLGGWFSPKKLAVPILGGLLNIGAFVVAFGLVSAGGSPSPETIQQMTDRQVHAIPHDGSLPKPADWVEAEEAAWQYKDVRVNLIEAHIGRVTLTGANKQKQTPKEYYLHVLLRVKNAGVRRRVEFSGWKPGKDGPELKDSTDQLPIRQMQFHRGWTYAVPKKVTKLGPKQSAKVLLIFERPSPAMMPLRLRLPGTAFGLSEPVQLLIPASKIEIRRGQPSITFSPGG